MTAQMSDESQESPDSPAKPPVVRGVPAVSRAVAILKTLSKSDAPQGLSQIASELGIVPSTCLHILRVLVAEGFVSFNKTNRKYAISSALFTIAARAHRNVSFHQMCMPHLDELSSIFGVTAVACRSMGLEHQTIVAISRSDKLVSLHVDVGSRFPALISASGRCLAAFGQYPPDQLEEKFHSLRWDNAPSFADWKAEVEMTRALGYALDEGKYIAGASILAAPVIMPDKTVNTISVIGFRDQMAKIGYSTISEDLRQRASTMSTG